MTAVAAPSAETESLTVSQRPGAGAWATLDLELKGLMPLVRNGCSASFARLYLLTAGRLFALVLRIHPSRPEAEEVLQDLYVRVWTERARFDETRGQAMSWLSAMARYGAIDSLRHRRARPTSAPAVDESHQFDCYAGFVSLEPGPADHAICKQSAQAVQSSLRALPHAQRHCLVLAFYDGLSHSEIAQRVNQPLGTVKSSVRRALLKMRPVLAAHG